MDILIMEMMDNWHRKGMELAPLHTHQSIKIDQDVQPPVASNGQPAATVHGKIVVNIRNDGMFLAEDTNITFANKDLLAEYIEEEKDKIKAVGNTPVLHIRADKRVDFKYCQRVIKAGAMAGVDQLAYGAYNKD